MAVIILIKGNGFYNEFSKYGLRRVSAFKKHIFFYILCYVSVPSDKQTMWHFYQQFLLSYLNEIAQLLYYIPVYTSELDENKSWILYKRAKSLKKWEIFI